MFPWLPFLSFDANARPTRRNRRRRNVRPRSSLDSVWLRVECGDGLEAGGVQVEYPRFPLRPLTATAGSSSSEINIASPATTNTERPDSAVLGDVLPSPAQPTAKRKDRVAVSQSEAPGSRSPRSASNSRPGSSVAVQPPAPLPPPRTNKRARMFETSSAMLELFGGTSSTSHPIPPTTSNVTELPTASASTNGTSTIFHEDVVASTSTYPPVPRAEISESNVEIPPETTAASCYQRIQSPPPVLSSTTRPNFGRTNALLRDGVLQTEWEPIPTSNTANSSSFQSVPDHELTYTNAQHRGNWESGGASFDLITQQPRRDYTPPRPNGTTATCPADSIVRQQTRIPAAEQELNGEVECPLDRRQELNGQEIPETSVSSTIQVNGVAPANRRVRPQREGVAEIFAFCAQRPADAAGESSSTSGASYRANGRSGSPDHKTPRSPLASRQSPQNDENREPVGFPTADKNNRLDDVQPNGRSQLNGSSELKAKNSAEVRLRRLLWAKAEDGSGMVAAGSNGSGGGSDSRPIVIRGAQIVNDDAIFAADVLVVDGTIRQILPDLEAPENAEQIDAAGRWLLPAGIDVHVEITNVGEDLQTATNAALSGGTTTLMNVVTVHSGESLTAAVERSRALIERYATCAVALSVPLSSWTEAMRLEVERLIAGHGVTSFVLELRNDSELFEAMSALKRLGALPCALPENRDLVALLERQFASLSAAEAYRQARPPHLESDTVNRLSTVAQLTNTPLALLSVGSSESCRAVQAGRQRGALVYAQIPIVAVTPESRSSNAPQSRIPIRGTADDVRDVVELLANGPLSVCTSDHATIRNSPTRPQIGSVTAAERLVLLWEKAVAAGRLDLMRFVAVTSANPAKLLGLYPRKGRIAVGADADLVVWNAKSTRTFGNSRFGSSERSTFDDVTVHASPELTICAGHVVFRNNALTNEQIPPERRWLPLQPNAPHVFSVVQLRDKTIDLGKPDDLVTSAPAVRKDSANSNGSGGIERPQSRDRAAQPPSAASRSATKVIHPPGGKSSGFW